MTKRSSDWHITGWAAILLAPIAIPVGLILSVLGIGKYEKRTPAEVAGFIRDFLESRGGEWDWDDFTSVPLDDPELESIRREADSVDLPLTEHGRETLRALYARAEILKSNWLNRGQPE